jgi:UDP-N-acetylmuramoylalanine--D-glutamate ligase
MDVRGVRTLVVGMARSGLACAELLRSQGALVRATDRDAAAGAPLAALGIPFDVQSPAIFTGCDLIAISPGVPCDLPELEDARARGVRVAGEVEVAGWFLKGPVIGVTGSNGKTTTTALTGHILREAGIPAQVGGNIGVAVSAMVASSRDDQWNVLELSSFQLETVAEFHAAIGVALNVTPDHLDRHKSMAAYSAAKARLFETQRAGSHAVLNADDAECVRYAGLTAASPVWFSSTHAVAPGVWIAEGDLWFGGERLMRLAEIPLRGMHNAENAMAAAAAARLAGAGLGSIASAVRSFPGVPHRLEFVRALGGVSYYNDSKATNVDAALKALDAFEGRLFVILGGKDKDSDYTPLARPLERKAGAVLLIGAAAPKIRSQLLAGLGPRLVDCGTLASAVVEAHRGAVEGDTVLLAPACASFDQFDNFEHRGRVFKDLVNRLEARA